MFREDDQNLPKYKKIERATILAKLKVARQRQGGDGEIDPIDLVKEVEDGNLSDLKPEEIPDDQVSDVEATNESLEQNTGESLTSALAQLEQKAEDDNLEFMTKFVNLYREDMKLAKQFYYQTKVHFDIQTDEGQAKKKKMLKKYLEGTQWVLYYYYRGSPHWRWFYPYHYAPMISDLGINIVQDFLGSTTIQNFEVDFNCPENPHPYTPFQQLLCIMPLKSFHLLPSQFKAIPEHRMTDSYPMDFGVDLNGKTMAYEAIVLIPFVDETKLLEEEAALYKAGFKLKDVDKIRNTIAFQYHAYKFDSNPSQPSILKSTLTHFTQPISDLSQVQIVREYESVGNISFKPVLMPGIEHPSPGYPSFKYLQVQTLEPNHKNVYGTSFVQQMVTIPQAIEETQPEELERWLNKLAASANKEVYVGFPFPHEAFPMYFEDKFTIYTLFGDVAKNNF